MSKRFMPLAVFAGILLIAAALRGQAFVANTRAYGDVSLMALAAKEYVLTSTIRYPSPGGRFPHTLDDPLATPAYMHGAGYPFLAGALARVLGTRDTFFTLKLIDFAAGICLAAVTMAFCRRHVSFHAAWIAGLWVATSPVLIDFSANGSPYILVALALSLLTMICMHFRFTRNADYAALAALCALSFQIHPSMLALTAVTLALGILNVRRLSVGGAAIFAGVWLLCYLPSLVWYLTYFERPFVSQQIFYLTGAMNLPGQELDMLRENPRLLLTMPYLEIYLSVMVRRAGAFLDNLVFELGAPMVLFAAGSALFLLFTNARRLMIMIVLPRLAYFAVTAAGLALLHMRFLVPVAPAFLIVAAIALSLLTRQSSALRRAAAVLALAYAGWAVWSYFSLDVPTTRYYRDEMSEDLLADTYMDIGRQMAGAPPGTLIGCGGVNVIAYYADLRVDQFSCPPTVTKVQRRLNRPEYDVRYVLVPKADVAGVVEIVGAAQVVAENDALIVFDLRTPASP